MGQIKVIVQNHLGSEGIPMELPGDVSIKQLVSDIAVKRGWPSSIPDLFWRFYRASPPRSYGLLHHRTGRIINDEHTLATAGVIDGDTLALLPNVHLDSPYLEDVILLPSGNRFSELALVVAVQVGDLITAFILPKEMPISGLGEYISWQSAKRKMSGLWIAGSQGVWRNIRSGKLLDLEANVGDVIQTGDLIRFETNKSTETTLIRITPADLEGRHTL